MSSDLDVIRQIVLSIDDTEFIEVVFADMCENVDAVPTARYSLSTDGRVIGLKLEGWQLTTVPDPVFDLSGLQYLSLAWNQIDAIDARLLNLPALDCVNFYYNRIHTLSHGFALGRWTVDTAELPVYRQNSINVTNNPLESPPLEIITKGRKAIADYFIAVEKESRPVREVKLLLIGHGAAGKTSVVRMLLGDKFNRDESTTHGIRIRPWQASHDGNDIKVNVWDFGGQEMMHSTHQFFMSKRSAYLIVLDGRKEDDPEYWLGYVRSFGGDSPVIVVLNKVDENPGYDVDRRFLMEKYPNIAGFHAVSCATGRGIIELEQQLTAELAGLDHIKTTWPESWFQVKRALESLDKDYITYDAFVELCEAQGIDEDSQRVLVDFLNDLGAVVHFNDPLLRETNVIRPEWVTSAVYVIVTSDELAEAYGILRRSTISKMLSARGYPKHKHDYIIELMQKFELCFALKDEPETLLIPALLAPNQPDFEFDQEAALAFVFDYDFLPPSMMHKFIVKMNRVILGGLRWRKGVVLRDLDFDSEALVRVDERDKRIQVFVSGARRRDFFAVIYKTFRDIHDEIAGLGVRDLVPLPGHASVFADYKGLLGLEEMGVAEYAEGNLRKRFQVRELLNGIEHERYRAAKRWDVFVSYSSKDADIVSEFVTRMKRAAVRYWFDAEQIQPGDSILSKIEAGLHGSSSLVALFSRHQLESGWCRQEYEAILVQTFSNRSTQRVIPVVLDGVEISELPITLQGVKYVEYSDDEQVEALLRMLRADGQCA